MRIGLLPLIIAVGVVEFWWIIVPLELFVLSFWFLSWRKRTRGLSKDYFTSLLITFFISIDLSGAMFFYQQTSGFTSPLWLILILTISSVLSLLTLILSLIIVVIKRLRFV